MVDAPGQDAPRGRWVGRVFKISLGVISIFILMCISGAFLSPKISVEQVTEIRADAEDVFYYLSDMEAFQQWSPWVGSSGHAEFVLAGAGSGVGQMVAWRCDGADCVSGSQEVQVSQAGELVQTDLILEGESVQATYAISPSERDGYVTVLMKVDRTLGGFPFAQRWLRFSKSASMESRFDNALERLKQVAEAEVQN